jgi:transcriptional regulator with XRE-family HTH domain
MDVGGIGVTTNGLNIQLRTARQEKNLTQQELAGKLEVTKLTVGRWERGTTHPDAYYRRKLCHFFQKTPEELGLLEVQKNLQWSTQRETVYLNREKILPELESEQPTFQEINAAQFATNKTTINNDSPLLQDIQKAQEPNEEEKRAAWELHVEVVTRIPVAILDEDKGMLREALSSMYTLFTLTRAILRNHGRGIAQSHKNNDLSLCFLAISMLDTTLRPLLSKWHPLLKDYEDKRPASVGALEHEQHWEKHAELRQEIVLMRKTLVTYAKAFAELADASSLTTDASEFGRQK